MCEYCNQVRLNNDLKHKLFSDNTCQVRLYQWRDSNVYTLEVRTDNSINKFYINNCPMCGRYLKED